MVTIARLTLPLILVLIFMPLPTLACEKLIVSANADNAPISFDNKGNLTGIGFDLFGRLISGLHTSIEITPPYPWKRVLSNSRYGKVDIIIGVQKTVERMQYLDFVEPAFTRTAHTVFFKKDKKNVIKSKEDLKYFRGGITLGSALDENFTNFMMKDLQLDRVAAVEQNFLKLMAGRVDYFIAPLLPTINTIQAEHSSHLKNLAFLSVPVSVTEEYIAISKKSRCNSIKRELSQLLQAIKSDRTFDMWLGNSMKDWGALDWYILNRG